MFIMLSESNLKTKKYKAVVYDNVTNKKIKTVQFGSKGMGDYLIYMKGVPFIANQRKELYIKRNTTRQKKFWDSEPLAPATLAKYLLWNKKTLDESIDDYLKDFPEIKKIIVSKNI